MGVRTVTDHTRLEDHERIHIDGMEVTVGMARDMGLIGGHTPDGGLSIGNATAAEPEVAPRSDTGHEGYDATAAQLHTQVEEGNLTETEAVAYETVVGEIALAGLTPAQITDTIDGIADGSVDPADLTQDQRQIIQNTEAKVTEAATQSAMTELGQEGFNDLQRIAAASPEVNAAIRTYAGMRSLGLGDVSWSDFYQDVKDHVAGH